MAELATIARPYAEALFKASSSDLAGTAVWLDELAAIAGNAQLQQFAESPKTSVNQVFDLIAGVAKVTLPDSARNFLKNAQSGSSDAVVYSAFPIDDAVLADVATTLQARFGRKLNVKVELEPALIGGIRVVVGDEVLDTSVKARLEQMKVALTA